MLVFRKTLRTYLMDDPLRFIGKIFWTQVVAGEPNFFIPRMFAS